MGRITAIDDGAVWLMIVNAAVPYQYRTANRKVPRSLSVVFALPWRDEPEQPGARSGAEVAGRRRAVT